MDNQHRLIKGYRELNADEINAMNAIKLTEQGLLFAIKGFEENNNPNVSPDPRWLAIAKTDLQKGFMALGRAIARPDGY